MKNQTRSTPGVRILNKIKKAPRKKSTRFALAMEVILKQGDDVRYQNWERSNRHINLISNNPGDYLREWGVDVEYGNNAPRGGQAGECIRLTEKGIRQTRHLLPALKTLMAEI